MFSVYSSPLSLGGESESVGGSGQVVDGLSQKSTEDAMIELLSWLVCGEVVSPSPVD